MDNFFPSSGSNKKNRKILYGPSTTTWSVPSGTTEVDIHVWGGGGGGFCCKGCPSSNCGAQGGGGGGYARARVPVTDADSLSITVGGNAATSSVSIPTQTPGSPLSATGGTNAGPTNYQSTQITPGGTGTVTLNPTFSTNYCMTATGGNGCASGGAGGGSAGSPKGDGNPGLNGGGGGIGGQGLAQGAGPTYGPGNSPIGGDGGYSGNIAPDSPTKIWCCQSGSFNSGSPFFPCNCPRTYIVCQMGNRNCCRRSTVITNLTTTCSLCQDQWAKWDYDISVNRTDDWFYVEDIEGGGGVQNVDAGPGGGGGLNSRAGFLGGASSSPYPYECTCSPTSTCNQGGCAGGSGANQANPTCCSSSFSTPGTPGVVIIYW